MLPHAGDRRRKNRPPQRDGLVEMEWQVDTLVCYHYNLRA